jgi:hypothetical protein
MARWRSRATARGGRTVRTLLRRAIHPARWWFLPIAAANLFPRRRRTLLAEFLGHGDRAANGRWRRRFHSSAREAMVIFFWSAPQDWGGEERGRNRGPPKSYIGAEKVTLVARISRRPLCHDPHGARSSCCRWAPRHVGPRRQRKWAFERCIGRWWTGPPISGRSIASAWWRPGCGPSWSARAGRVVKLSSGPARETWIGPDWGRRPT